MKKLKLYFYRFPSLYDCENFIEYILSCEHGYCLDCIFSWLIPWWLSIVLNKNNKIISNNKIKNENRLKQTDSKN